MQQDTPGGLVQKTCVMLGNDPASPEEIPEKMVLKISDSSEVQPDGQPDGQADGQPAEQSEEQPTEQPKEQHAYQSNVKSIPSRTSYSLIGLDTQMFIHLRPR